MAENRIMYLAGNGYTWDQDQADIDSYGKPIICPGALSKIMLRNRRVIDQVGEFLLDETERLWDLEEQEDASTKVKKQRARVDALAEAFAILTHPAQYKEDKTKAIQRIKEWVDGQFQD